MSTVNGGDDFASLLRRHRASAGLSQEELAGRASLSADAVAALERGRRRAPRPLTVRLLASALNLDDGQWTEFVESLHGPAAGHAHEVHGPPMQADPLIGRVAELAELRGLLGDEQVRLLTLTGVGGVGKTRLAVAVADAVQPGLDDSVCWVSLADRPDGAEVTDAVAAALGVRPGSDGDELDTIAEQIGARRVLLVLDNSEHVVGTCAQVATALLRRCPRLLIVVTSRELLRVPGEVVREVRPLPVPPSRAEPDEIHDTDSVRLFLARAGAHGIQLPEDRLVHVSRVCRQVEGIPLAIELAAARVNVLTVEQIAAELTASSGILSGGSRTAHRRQQTIEAALDWSYALLDPAEREFFENVATFAGGWTLAAAQDVCCAETDHTCRARVLDLTGRLIDKSLIVVDREGAEARYGMYMVIRQYAENRLDDSGRRPEVELRHQRHLVHLAERAEAVLESGDQDGALRRLDTELDNLRVALGRAVSHGHGDDAVRLAGALWRYFYLRGTYAEGQDWLQTALQVAGEVTDPRQLPGRAKAMRGLGYLAFLQCDYDEALRRLDDALSLYQRAGDELGAALVLRHLGSVAREHGDYDRAMALHQHSREIYARRSDATGTAWSRHHLGFVSWLREDFEAAHEHATAALEHFQRVGEGEGVSWAHIDLGVIALYRGHLDAAEQFLHHALERAQRLGYREGVAWSLNQLGAVALRQQRPERAIQLLDESLAEHLEFGDRWRAASVLDALAAAATQRGDHTYAGFLLAAAAAARDAIGVPVPACERAAIKHTLRMVRDNLSAETLERVWAAGHATPLHAVADGYLPG
ncbi:putative ATPase [Haloactinopolyspora alba]|uniref:Putative ATPase n=1 Tax=Haloactinopolyspora alba TaxID=648780 RepID=A0A2P8DNA8_9ACTN|nr:tetratricopeptide repeat protein [Haloactinopolyspora alba]PSK98683.1 putative ATPase [Haloactinopolyspora alba]